MEKRTNNDLLALPSEFIDFETVIYSMIIIIKVKISF